MNYTKMLPVTGVAIFGTAGYWLVVGIFVVTTVLAALLHHKLGRIK